MWFLQIRFYLSESHVLCIVLQAIRALGEKFPRKYNTLMNFLSGMLRDEGGLDYKAAIADTIITIIKENPDAKDTGKYLYKNI